MQPVPEGRGVAAAESAEVSRLRFDPDADKLAVTIERLGAESPYTVMRRVDDTLHIPRELHEQWAAAMLERYRVQFEGGDRYALMRAIAICARDTVTIPDWAAVAFLRGFDAVHNYRAKSWDKVFGPPFPKGGNLNARRKKKVTMFQVYNTVREIKARDTNRQIDKELWAEVAKRLHIGKRRAKEWYYTACKVMRLA